MTHIPARNEYKFIFLFFSNGAQAHARETLSEPQAEAMASQWVHRNYVRAALTLVGWIAALRAFSLL